MAPLSVCGRLRSFPPGYPEACRFSGANPVRMKKVGVLDYLSGKDLAMRHFLRVFPIIALLTVTALAQDAPQPSPLLAGFAVADITPPLGLRMSGYFSERLATGTKDPLYAKAMVLRQGETSAAVVCCDLLNIDESLTADVRARVEAEQGIPGDHVVLTATHTHTGPLYGDVQRFFTDDPDVPPDEISKQTAVYETELRDRIVAAIAQADAAARPVQVRRGGGDLEGIAFNRRFYMKDGTVRCNPGKLNPDIVRAAGPVDTEVGLIAFADGTGALKALFTSFALHLDTTGGTEYSADYPGYLQRSLRDHFSADLVSMFGTGTCGDINHIDVSHNEPQKGLAEPERIGTALADAVIAAEPGLAPVSQPQLGVARAVVEAPKRPYTEEELRAAKETARQLREGKTPFLDNVHARRVIHVAAAPGDTIPLDVQVLRLSDDAAIVFLPGEVFVELGMDIKRSSPFATTLVVELANSYPSYIPTARAFAEGSYEVVSARIQSGWAEQMAEAVRRLLYQLKYGTQTP